MSRVILIVIMATWVIGVDQLHQSPKTAISRSALSIFVGGYFLLVCVMAVWARIVARRLFGADFRSSLRRYHWLAYLSRWIIPAWLAFGVLSRAGWARHVVSILGPKFQQFQLPGLLLGTAPAMLTWMALWWAEFPAERALREQNAFDELMQDLPVHAPPGIWRYLITALRQQLLPIVLPVLLIIFMRDLLVLAIGKHLSPAYTDLAMLPAAGMVYIWAAEILRRLFNARPLDDSPLRRRLERMCQRVGLRYRDILLWQTDYSVANAAVIGILPRWRYVLLSDRLLETMSDAEIEAVFAHEAGHIVHHHMTWLAVFVATIVLASLGPIEIAGDWVLTHIPQGWATQDGRADLAVAIFIFALTIYLMGCLSRSLERQADVFAAKLMEGEVTGDATTVGPTGVEIVSSALRRVAFVNNIPLRARDLFHPSIYKRLQYLKKLAEGPSQTQAFDRFMSHLYWGLIATLVACAGIAAFRMMR